MYNVKVIRVETESGHLSQPGHVLSLSSGSDLIYKYPGLTHILHIHWIMCINIGVWFLNYHMAQMFDSAKF